MTDRFHALLAGDVAPLSRWLKSAGWRDGIQLVAVIVIGSGVYGATMGLWRDPLQALYTAIKFPAMVLLTCGGNSAFNGCLASLLGSGLGFRQTTLAILMSFAVMAIILAAFAPVMLFLLWNTPPLDADSEFASHGITLLSHVAIIAGAGFAANRRLLGLIAAHARRRSDAWRVLAGWLAGNLVLGSQLAWILRPFIGSPNLPVQFLRPDPLTGSFFEAILRAFRNLIH